MDTRSLAKHIDTVAFSEFLNELSRQQADELPQPANRFTSERGVIDTYLDNYTQAVVMETYLAMAEMFEAIPLLTELKPKWTMSHQPDNMMIVDFAMTMIVGTNTSSTQVSAGYAEFDKIHENMPNLFPKTAAEAFENAIDCGEGILPEHWNFLVMREICNPSKSFTSKKDVISAMNSDLEKFLPDVKKWALEQQVREQNNPETAKAAHKPKM